MTAQAVQKKCKHKFPMIAGEARAQKKEQATRMCSEPSAQEEHGKENDNRDDGKRKEEHEL